MTDGREAFERLACRGMAVLAGMMLAGCGGNLGAPIGLTFAGISAGEFHTCGVRPSGAAYCWGGGELGDGDSTGSATRSEEHTSEFQSLTNLVCRLLLEK